MRNTLVWRAIKKHLLEGFQIENTDLKSACRKTGGSHPLAVLLLQVKVVSWVDAFFHAPAVPGHPTLDGHVPGSRTQCKLLQVFHTNL